ncbi:hypothetical protein [Alloactinosynnema sp. L-07]|nr:hypothetical protein [Alloactinosynnema sp. L-07]
MRLLAERHRAGLRIDERLTACAEATQIFRRRHAEASSTEMLRHLIGALGNQAGVLLDDFPARRGRNGGVGSGGALPGGELRRQLSSGPGARSTTQA